MRVIAGIARSLPLKAVDGLDTRPTTDRIKETLFNMINSDLPDCKFLDLFAGSGAIGIEALSRGASNAVFIDNSYKSIECITENLKFTKFDNKARIIKSDVALALSRLDNEKEVYDIIFIDPPYGKDYEKSVIEMLYNSSLIDEYTTIILEAKIKTDYSYITNIGFEIKKVKQYKTNMHIFFNLKEVNKEL